MINIQVNSEFLKQLNEKISILKTRLFDLEICYNRYKKDKYIPEIKRQIKNVKSKIKNLENINQNYVRDWEAMEKIKEEKTDLEKFKDLYDEMSLTYCQIKNEIKLYKKGFIVFDENGKYIRQYL